MRWIVKEKNDNGITLIALVITIIVLLILAGVAIATLTGENGILKKADTAKQQTEEKSAKEKIELAIASSMDKDGSFNVEDFEKEIKNLGGTTIEKTEETITVEMDDYEAVIDIKTGKIIKFENTKGIKPEIKANLCQEDGNALVPDTEYETVILSVNITNEEQLGTIDLITVKDSKGNIISKENNIIGEGKESFKVAGTGTYTITVKATTDGVSKEVTIKVPIKVASEGWEITSPKDVEWYNYGNSKINEPKLTGEMTPIKYIGEEQPGNKWANAETVDGSMWVWIPRFAYKITKGYQSSSAGTIEVAFLDVNNNFLNGETGELITDDLSKITYSNYVQNQWLLHPAFASNAENGGGFGEIEGFWIGKFETTGNKTDGLSVKAGQKSLCNMIINEQYKLARDSKFGEMVDLNSHMTKSSEWGACCYLAHSKYGTNSQNLEKGARAYTGGSNKKAVIYKTNKKQSTTHNATGVYDMAGGFYEITASYVDTGSKNLSNFGGTNQGDFYGNDEERGISTPYKMVYKTLNRNR